MLYCPKCQKTYEDASQRFCLNDGRRLIRVAADNQFSSPTNGVFANVLNRKVEAETEKSDHAPRFSRARIQRAADSDFLPPFEAEIFEVNVASASKTEIIESAFEAVPLSEPIVEPTFEPNAETEVQVEPEPEIETAPPEIQSELKTEIETRSEAETETETETVPEIESEIAAEVETVPEAAISEPEMESEIAESAIETQPEPEKEIEIQSDSETADEIQPSIENEGDARSEIETEDEVQIKPESEIQSEIETVSQTQIEADNEARSAIEAESENTESSSEVAPRFIAPWEIPHSEAQLGDRKTNLKNREILTWKNPSALLEQTIKGRYLIVAQTGKDANSLVYLAEDKLVPNKKVVVRVLMNEDENDSFASKIYAEERISLSHFRHPNIANLIDSGELPEGKPFIIGEFIEGKSVEEFLKSGEKFDGERVARIVRQAAYALSEVHQCGILHRNLKAENVVLTINDKGAEQVKLTGFGAANEKLNDANLPYKSPEQIEGKLANVTSDEYALAVVAYRMLHNKMPFKAPRAIGKLLKARRDGLNSKPAKNRVASPAAADKIFERALAFDTAERYPKTRDFGDAFYETIFANADLKTEESKPIEPIETSPETPIVMPPVDSIPESEIETAVENKESATIEKKIEEQKIVEKTVSEKVVESKGKSKSKIKTRYVVFAVVSAMLLIFEIWGIWFYSPNRAAEPQEIVQNPAENTKNIANQTTTKSPELPANNQTFQSTAPPDTNYFQNGKANLKDEAAQNYLGFSLNYPKNWRVNVAGGGDAKTRGTFLDVSKNAESGTPVEQMIVSYYDSNGTFEADAKNFPKELIETNRALNKIIPNYVVVSEGEAAINNLRAYEVKFKGSGTTPAGEKLTLWGKRLFVPAAANGAKNGYMITLLATSLSSDVQSVEDVGVKGDLPKILQTFKPNPNF